MQNLKVKRIVCLANSRKLGGRCIAGKELLADGVSGSWIRPVSHREFEEVFRFPHMSKDIGTEAILWFSVLWTCRFFGRIPKHFSRRVA